MPSKNSIILFAIAICCILIISISLSSNSSSSIINLPPINGEDDEGNNNNDQQQQQSSPITTAASPPVVVVAPNNNEENNNNIHDGKQHHPNQSTDRPKQRDYLGVDKDILVPDAFQNGCGNMLPDVPLTPLEEELRYLLEMTTEILHEKKLIGWPADGTLLGLVRNGRVATDRDIDYQIHSTYQWCANHLHSLKAAFEARTKIRMFKVVHGKFKGKKIGRYAMVRMPPKYGDFGTGIDFNCVYTDGGEGHYTMHVHKGTIEKIPAQAFPLKFCLAYGRPIPCPQDPMAVLGMFTPRYDGCMIFPHCTGDPLKHGKNKKCLTPHYPLPRKEFAEVVKKLDSCGWVSLKKHMEEESQCNMMLEDGDQANKCEKIQGWKYPLCFLQGFIG